MHCVTCRGESQWASAGRDGGPCMSPHQLAPPHAHPTYAAAIGSSERRTFESARGALWCSNLLSEAGGEKSLYSAFSSLLSFLSVILFIPKESVELLRTLSLNIARSAFWGKSHRGGRQIRSLLLSGAPWDGSFSKSAITRAPFKGRETWHQGNMSDPFICPVLLAHL